MKSSLIRDKPADEGGAAVVRGQFHAVEPGRPAFVQATLDPDLVPTRMVEVFAGHSRTVGVQLVTGRHIIW